MDVRVDRGASAPQDERRKGTFPCKAQGIGGLADYERCIAVTTIPVRNGTVCNGCTSRWKHCKSCIQEGIVREEHAWVVKNTDLCAWHTEHGTRASKKRDPQFLPSKKLRDVQAGTPPKVDVPATKSGGMGHPIPPVSAVSLLEAIPDDATEWKTMLQRVKRAVSSSVLISVDPRLVRPMKNQPRQYFHPASLQGLKDSMEESGQLMPGMVRSVSDGQNGVLYELLDGERRWRAVQELPGMLYRALVVEVEDNDAPYVIAVIANFNRAAHTSMEIADSIEALRKRMVPMETIAKMCGFTAMWAYQIHGLQQLHPELRDKLDQRVAGKNYLPLTAALHISKMHQDLQLAMADQVISKRVTLAALRGEVVRVSHEHGAQVRTRALEPRKRWEKFRNRGVSMGKYGDELLQFLGEAGARALLQDRHQDEVRDFITLLERTGDRLVEVIQKVREFAGRKN